MNNFMWKLMNESVGINVLTKFAKTLFIRKIITSNILKHAADFYVNSMGTKDGVLIRIAKEHKTFSICYAAF